METMSPLDASFLHIEDAVTHMHIGSVGIFEGPPPGPGEVKDAIAARLPLVPRYRQKVRFVPLALGRPVWVDDPHFNLDYHVRRTALPSPGGDDELRNLVGRVMSQQLDRTQAAVGAVGGRGPGLRALGADLQDPPLHGRRRLGHRPAERDPLERARGRADAARRRGTPIASRARLSLVTHSLSGRAASPYEATRTALAAVRGPRRVAKKAVDTGRGLANFRTLLAPGRDELAERPDRAAPALGLGARASV